MAGLGSRLLHTRWLVRAPIWLFRAHLGFLFGGRLLLLEHIGRKSGARRYVVLEAVTRPDTGTVIVASGFGTGSQWYRNLRANPECRVSIGARSAVPATAHLLEPGDSRPIITEYREQHPRAYRELEGVVREATGDPIEEVPLVKLALR